MQKEILMLKCISSSSVEDVVSVSEFVLLPHRQYVHHLRHWTAKSAPKALASRVRHVGVTMDTLHVAKALLATVGRPRDDRRKEVSRRLAGGRC